MGDTAYTPLVEKVVMTCSGMPNQFEGFIDGFPFYFRARHGSWSLRIAEHGGDPVAGEQIADGDDNEAGWWEEKEARAALDVAIEQAHKSGRLQEFIQKATAPRP